MTVVLAFAFTAGTSHSHDDSSSTVKNVATLPAVHVDAPPSPTNQAEDACVTVLAALPSSLTPDLPPRRVDSTSSLVRAWGEPAVVLRCAVAKPTNLVPESGEQIVAVNGVNWLPVQTSTTTVFTTIDRAVAVELVVPKASVVQPLPVVSDAVAKLPAVCTTIDAAGNHDANLPVCGAGK